MARITILSWRLENRDHASYTPNGLDLFQLAAGTRSALFARDEVDFVQAVPGQPRRFILARSNAAGNVQSLVDLP